jgi:hypothetical protein
MIVYRVHWLKAKSRRDCWREEQILLASEMEWTERFFHHRASHWQALATGPSNAPDDHISVESKLNIRHSQGHICYALKLESMWSRLAQQAALQFNIVKADIRPLEPSARSRPSSEQYSDA